MNFDLENLEYSRWTRMWLMFCAVLHALTGISMLGSGGNVLLGILPLVTAALYLLLFTQKKWFFFFAICAMLVISVVMFYLNGTGMPLSIAILNPILTYLILRQNFNGQA